MRRRPDGGRKIAALFVAITVAGAQAGDRLSYPPSPRAAQTDSYHGQVVADPYRWLEDTGSAATQSWIQAQNALTRAYLERLPARSWFAARMRRLIDHERFGLPQHEAGVYVYTYNSGTDEQDSLWVTSNAAERGRVLLDPVALRADGTVSIASYRLAPDGRMLAYALSDGGSDWNRWRIRDTQSGRDWPESLGGTKFTEVSWARDSHGFYYSRYPSGPDGSYDDRRQVSIWFHAIGTDQARDLPVFRITDHATRDPYPFVTEDGAWLIITVRDGYQSNGVYIMALGGDHRGEVVRLLDRWDARYEFLGNEGPTFYFQTTHRAPGGRIIAIDSRSPAIGNWREIVAEQPQAIAAASLVGGRLIVQYLVDVKAEVRVFDRDGLRIGTVALPGAGTVTGFDGPSARAETYFSYTDFLTPRSVFRYDVGSGAVERWRAPSAPVRPDDYIVRQVHYPSRDGTLIPMYVVHRRDLPPDRRRPAVLYGYGGFNVSLLPAWSVGRVAWLEAGGVFALANLRGGGEFGEHWHESGTKLRKQNVFDDFIGAAEWLTREGYTGPEHLAIWGGSNGGLLVGAVLNQRPELFAAAVPAVGVMDMLRYQLASANARQWSSDYGLSEVPAEFAALSAYSPYHNLHPGKCYPATLVFADANDDRVAAWHSYKYAAALQHAQGCERPVLIRIETRSGHGAGASISKVVDEYADQWAFVAEALGLGIPGPRP